MDKIQLLPDSVANQIAAGEVIQRPASVIKELVENAVDARARKIDVLVVDAGKTSIQVIDDGVGMSVTDARLAFERHATSKIRKADDLFTLTTMGFRGEALPSVASVAQVTLRTCMQGQSLGTQIRIDGGELQSQEPVPCPVGSNFLVENLFFNIPVRRRFLKSNITEMNNIIAAFQRIVLVYPDIHFTLSSNGQEIMSLPATNTHRRIIDVFGKKLNPYLLPLDVETSLGKVFGFVGKPESAKKKAQQQYFFVNGRYMKHPSFHKAVMSAYHRLIKDGDQVPYFIYFDIDPKDIDVNIHPTKTEIKFRDEQSVWHILLSAVKDAVGKFSTITTIDFDTEGRPDLPAVSTLHDIHVPTISINTGYNPFAPDAQAPSSDTLIQSSLSDSLISSALSSLPDSTASDATASKATASHSGLSGSARSDIRPASLVTSASRIQSQWQRLYDQALPVDEREQASLFEREDLGEVADGGGTPYYTAGSQTSSSTSPPDAAAAHSQIEPRSHEHYQYKGSYLLTSVASGLMVTDQERAHERILFERFMREIDTSAHASQRLLFPDSVQFTIEQMVVLPEILPEMERLGFELTNLGGGSYAINAIPAGLEGANTPQLIYDMVATAAEAGSDISHELYASLAAGMARTAAVTHGQVLTAEEMEQMISDLLQCENYRYTPDGRPIFQIMPHETLLSSF